MQSLVPGDRVLVRAGKLTNFFETKVASVIARQCVAGNAVPADCLVVQIGSSELDVDQVHFAYNFRAPLTNGLF